MFDLNDQMACAEFSVVHSVMNKTIVLYLVVTSRSCLEWHFFQLVILFYVNSSPKFGGLGREDILQVSEITSAKLTLHCIIFKNVIFFNCNARTRETFRALPKESNIAMTFRLLLWVFYTKLQETRHGLIKLGPCDKHPAYR